VRPLRFGIIVLVLAFAYCGFVLWRLLRIPTPPISHPAPRAADLDAVKGDLCRLARAERAFFGATGHYAPENELRSNGDLTLPHGTRWPYHYGIYVPVPNRFVIVATTYGPLEKRPPALLIDADLQICTATSIMPHFIGRLDSPPQHWGDTAPSYDCEKCK
jgi:hypothetical protein